MFSTADTIVAIATPPGRGGLGVVRLSGADAFRIASALAGRPAPFEPRHATFVRLHASDRSGVGDEVIVTCFPNPRSYTGEDVAEISAHGSPVVLASILRRAMAEGARLAEPGEFTLRAFLNGRRDLVQAEAVADLIDAVTPLQARAAFDQLEGTLTRAIAAIDTPLFELSARLEASLDFPDEGYHFVEPEAIGTALDGIVARLDGLLADAGRGRLVREGAQVAIVGAPNVGKSSLFNALLNTNRAIVTAVPGTTRDVLTERADIRGLSLALVDTAGIRDTDDEIEREGVARSQGTLAVADLALVVLDRSRPASDEDARVLQATRPLRRVVVVNKIDLAPAWEGRVHADVRDEETVDVSTRTGEGLDRLADRIASTLADGDLRRDPPAVTNLRHVTLLEAARVSLDRARTAHREACGTLPEELLLADLQDARERLEEVTGRRSAEDVLRHIFERFCVGK